MDIVSHIQEMLAKGTVSAYIALGIAGVVGILMFFGLIKGLTRGITRQTVRFLTIIASIAIAFFAASGVTGGIIGFFEGRTVEEAINEFGFLNEALAGIEEEVLTVIYGINPAVIQQVLALPFALFISPLVFIIVFVFVSFFMLIVHAIISGACGFSKRKNNALTRLLGMILGAVQGIVVAAVILVPVSNIMGIVSDTVGLIERPEETVMVSNGNQEAPEETLDIEKTILDVYDEFLADAVESPILKLVDAFGGSFINEQLATVKIGGVKRDMRDTIPGIFGISLEAAKLADLDIANITPEDESAIKGIINKIMDEPFTATIIVEGFRVAASVVDAGIIDMGDVPEPVEEIISAAASAFKESTVETVKSDFGTLCEVFFIVAKSDLMSDLMAGNEIDPMTLLQATEDNVDDNMIVKILNELNDNERFSGIITISINIMIDAINPPEGEEPAFPLPEEFADYAFILTPVLDHFAGKDDISTIISDVKTVLIIMGDVFSSDLFDENGEMDESADMLDILLYQENPLILTILNRFSENSGLEEMIIGLFGSVADAMNPPEGEEPAFPLPDEVADYAFLLAPVLEHFGGMETLETLVEDVETIILVIKDLDEAGILNGGEIDILDVLLYQEFETELPDGTTETNPLIIHILNRFSANDGLEEMIVGLFGGLANAMDPESESSLPLPEEFADYAFLLAPVFEHFGGMETLETLVADVETIILVIKDLDEAGIIDGGEIDILDVLLHQEFETELPDGTTETNPLIIHILNRFSANDGLEEMIIGLLGGIADAIIPPEGEEPAFELPEEVADFAFILAPVLDHFGKMENLDTLIADVETIILIVEDLDDSGILDGGADMSDPIAFLLGGEGEDGLIQKMLGKVSENPEFESVIMGVISEFATAFAEGELDESLDLGTLNGDVRNIVNSIVGAIAEIETAEDLEENIIIIKEVYIIIMGVDFDNNDDIVALLFGSDGENDSLIIEVLGKINGTMFEAPMLDAIAAFAKSPEFLEGLDPETAGIVLPFLDVFAGEDVDIEKLIADVETIQEIILLLNEKGIIDGDEDTDYLDILFVVHAGESESLIEYIIGELKATSFKDAIVNAFKSLADKDDHGNYKILDGADEIAVTMVAPLLAVVGETANMENIEADMALIVDVVALMYECGLMGEQVGDDEAIVSALFKKPAGEQDNYLAKMFDVFVGTRYDAALTTAITTLLEDELDMSESDPSLVVVINATKTLVGTINELSDIKVDVNAIGDVVMMLEEVFNSDDVDILALLTGDGNGETIIHKVLDELETPELKQFMLDIVTGLAEGVVNAYDEDAAADAIKITLGELGEPALSFVIAAMEILADIDNIEQLANDVSTIAKVIAILEEEELITDGDKPVDLVALFTEKVEGETVIDKILAVFEENSDLNPLLVVLARSMAEYIDLMDVAAPFDVLVHSIANVFSTSTEETVGDDIATVANVFEILVSEGVLEADNADILVTLTTKDGSGNTVVDRIVDELDSNERTKPIVAEFTKVSLSLIVSGSTEAGGATTPEQKEELEQTYEDVKTGIDEVINVGIQNQDKAPEEQKEIISDKLTEIFNNTLGSTEGGDGDDSGEVPPITDVIDKEIVDSMAGFIVDEYLTKDPEDPESEIKLDDLIGTLYEEVPVVDDDGNQIFDEDGNPETTTQISDAGLADVILNYYEAYLEWLENQNSGN